MHIIDVYTDGSSLIRGNYYEAESAVMIYLDGNMIDKFAMFHKNGTNSFGELYAIMSGLDKTYEIISTNPELEDSEVRVISDSGYLINSLRSYIYNWSKTSSDFNWITANCKPVKYQKIFKYLWWNYIGKTKYKRIKNLSFYHTHGHVGSKHSLSDSYNHFTSFNKVDISLEEFHKIVERNNLVDNLVDSCRMKKIYYYEEGDPKWVKNIGRQRRNGKIVVRARRVKRT